MKTTSLQLEDLWPCFQGIVPAALSTCAADGTPNITFISQVYYVDEKHVAISFQFFNKTHRNIRENPFGCVIALDPRTLHAYRFRLRFDHSESTGPLFESMSLQLQAVASYSGMSEVFRLLAADVYEVCSVERLEGFTRLPAPPPSERSSRLFVDPGLVSLRLVAERLNKAQLLDEILQVTLQLLEERFGFQYSMILFADEQNAKLLTIASRGYAENGAGSEVGMGEGLIGMVGRARRTLYISAMDHGLRYARAVRDRVESLGKTEAIAREIPLPGLPDAASQIAVPLVTRGRLVGVLAVESKDPLAFLPLENSLLTTIGAHLATAIDQLSRDQDDAPVNQVTHEPSTTASCSTAAHRFVYFQKDDCIFVDGDYLIRNVPARILWRLLRQYRDEGRVEFTNRELRMDAWLGLPELKDNLETRLILLRRRLEQKCPDVRLVHRGRGRFALETDAAIALVEKEG
ncbi:MAG: GAF domain-containing protein [Nitrospira sp.]|nr:GAF domain-containing protein [Nitrospira sp.]